MNKFRNFFKLFILVFFLGFTVLSSSGCEWFNNVYKTVRQKLGLASGGDGNTVVSQEEPTPVEEGEELAKGYAKKVPAFLFSWGGQGVKPGYFQSPLGIAIDYYGNVYVSDTGNCRIQKFAYDSKKKNYVYVNAYGKRGSDIGELDKPYGLAIWDDYLYIADNQNSRITRIDFNGQFLSAKGNDGNELGEVHQPAGLNFDEEGSLFIADTANNRVQKVDYESLENNTAYSKSGAIERYTGTANINNPWNTHFPKHNEGPNAGQFTSPWGVLPLPSGDVLVIDTKNHRIQKFGPHGDFIDQWGKVGREKGEFQFPTFAVLDQFGYVLVVDTGNHRVQKFTTEGEFLNTWGEGGYMDGQFNQPHGIALNPRNDYIFVVDTESHRVQVFAYKTMWGSPLKKPEGDKVTEPVDGTATEEEGTGTEDGTGTEEISI